MKYLIALALLVIATAASAADMTIEFTYAPSDPVYEAAAYRIYSDGTQVCSADTAIVDPATGHYVLDCTSPILPGSHDITMTAVYDGGETPHSAPMTITVPVDAVSPEIQRLTITVNGVDLVFVPSN